MRALLDVNVLIALLDTAHPHHIRALEWLTTDGRQGWASCALTENGCVRIMSQTSYPQKVPMRVAAARLEAVAQTSNHRFWGEPISILDQGLFALETLTHPRQITDVYLLALAVKNHGRLVTFDASIPLPAVRAAKSQHLCVV